MLYNFPGICNGLDLDVPLIRKLAMHKNIVGIKLSCGSVGKAVSLAAALVDRLKEANMGLTFSGSSHIAVQVDRVRGVRRTG